MSDEDKKKLYQFFEQSGYINSLKAREIGEFFNQRSIDKKQLMLKEGQVNNENLILEEVCMRAYIHDTTGMEVTTAFTILHTIRIGVEIVLYGLFFYKAVPGLMTFEGRNMDIISGLSAPLVYYFGYKKVKLSTATILGWNLICLAILLFTVINAVLSAPTPIQQWAFDRPVIAILYFPFV